jgi:DNA-binding response OmpR family regulator
MRRPKQKQILVVDDDESVRRTLGWVLAEQGYRVQSAADGKEALALAKRARPDLVVLDLKLPDKSGWDVFGRLVQSRPLLPVVVITSRPNQLFTALAAGVAALLEKPLHIPKLVQTVGHLLRESVEARVARVSGRLAEFYYVAA